MLIKLQPAQVTQFWDDIKKGMIDSYEIPKEFQQDFANSELVDLLSGMTQCWVGLYLDDNKNKHLQYIITARIIDNKYYKRKVLNIDSFYSLMPLDKKALIEVYKSIYDFAIANNCSDLEAMRKDKGIEKMLTDLGFKPYKIVYRKDLV